jgi:hypothetical protein
MTDGEAFGILAGYFNALAYLSAEELMEDVKNMRVGVKRDQVYKYWRQTQIQKGRGDTEKVRVDKLAKDFRDNANDRIAELSFQRHIHWTKKSPRLKHKPSYG